MTERDKELQRMILVRDLSLKTAEENRGTTRDFFLSQTMRIESDILKQFGYIIKGSKKKLKELSNKKVKKKIKRKGKSRG